MSIAAKPGTTSVRVERCFKVADAHVLRETLTLFAPVKHVTIDFRGASPVEDAALPILAEIVTAHPTSRVELFGLSRHHWRVLRYMGVTTDAVAGLADVA